MLASLFVLAATLTLLPAVLAKLGPKVDALALPLGALRRAPLAALRPLGRAAVAPPALSAPASTLVLVLLALPVLGLKTGMPSIKVVPEAATPRASATSRCSRRSAPARRAAADRRARRAGGGRRAARSPRPRHRPRLAAQPGGDGLVLIQAVPNADPSSPPSATRSTGCASTLPARALVGGAAAENHDLEQALAAKTPLVIGVVLALGFLLLLVALQAPLIAALGVLTNLLATGAAFGVARWIFQDGHGAGLLGFQPQGFLDAWGPVFFFAMIFAISMDYTVFLLSVGQGALGPRRRRARGDGRRPRPLRARDLRRRRGDGRGVLHLRAVRAAAAEGDGHHPRRRRAARRVLVRLLLMPCCCG